MIKVQAMTTQERLAKIVDDWKGANPESLQVVLIDSKVIQQKLNSEPLDRDESQEERDYDRFVWGMATHGAALAAMLQTGEIEIRCVAVN